MPNCVVGASITQWKGINNDVELFYPSGALTVDVNFMKLFPKGSTELTLYGECEYDEYEIILKNYEGAISDNRWLITNNEAHLKYTVDSEDITLPTVGDHWYDFISWVDENGTSQKVVTANLLKNINLYANQKLKEFRVNFYKAYDATEPFDSKKLTKINYQCPSIEDKHFAGWYCRDSDNNEIEFKEGVVLQDNMKVYAKYFASSENTSGDTGFYSFMTNNGIKITDNEAVETVVASTVFVMLALGTFLFVFKRH